MVPKGLFYFGFLIGSGGQPVEKSEKFFCKHTQMALNCKELTAPCKPLAETVYLRLGVKSEPRTVKSGANKGRHEQASSRARLKSRAADIINACANTLEDT